MEWRLVVAMLISALLVSSVSTKPTSRLAQNESATAFKTTPEVANSQSPEDEDLIIVPDGTALPIEVVDGYSSTTARVGDLIDFSVVFGLRADGLSLIPPNTHLTARVVKQGVAGRGMKNGAVEINFDELKLASGESATVRAFRKPESAVAKGVQAVDSHWSWYVLGGFAAKGTELNVAAGTLGILYLNGPLRVNRKTTMELQNTSGQGYAYVFATYLPYLACGQRFLPELGYNDLWQLKLNPGSYWFSTDAYIGKYNKHPQMRKAKVELTANHEYEVQLDNHHELVVKELDDRTRSGHHIGCCGEGYHKFFDLDLSNPTRAESAVLAAEPTTKPRDSY